MDVEQRVERPGHDLLRRPAGDRGGEPQAQMALGVEAQREGGLAARRDSDGRAPRQGDATVADAWARDRARTARLGLGLGLGGEALGDGALLRDHLGLGSLLLSGFGAGVSAAIELGTCSGRSASNPRRRGSWPMSFQPRSSKPVKPCGRIAGLAAPLRASRPEESEAKAALVVDHRALPHWPITRRPKPGAGRWMSRLCGTGPPGAEKTVRRKFFSSRSAI